MKKKGTAEPVLFRGAPSRVEGFVPQPYEGVMNGSLGVRIDTPEPVALTEQGVRSAPVGEVGTRVRLPLPESTSAGTYQGTIEIGGVSYPIEVHVNPYALLTVSPQRLSLVLKPGGRSENKLTVVNRGNVVSEVPRKSMIDLLDSEAVPLAFLAAVRGKEQGAKRVSKFADQLARNHGGMLSVEVVAGSGAIGQGEFRDITVRLTVPKGLPEGHTFRGEWPLPNLKYVIEILVAASARATENRQ